MFAPEHAAALDAIAAKARDDSSVFALFLIGSWDTGNEDNWSDLDLLAVCSDTDLNWLPDLGPIFAQESRADSRGRLYRLVYDHGLMVDLLNTTPDALAAIEGWERVPFHKGVRPFVGDCERYSTLLEAAAPTDGKPDVAALAHELRQFRFVAVQSLKKLVRGDWLISEHLALEAVQAVMVSAMIARELSASFVSPDLLAQISGSIPERLELAARIADSIGGSFIGDYEPCAEVIRSYCAAVPATYA